MKDLLSPKMDFIFKQIFGNEKHPNILISFLNAVLEPRSKVSSVIIKDRVLEKEYITNKYSILDVRAETEKGEKINIEIQRSDQKNIIERSMYHASKMYSEDLLSGEDYSNLKRSICINIIDFNYFEDKRYHRGMVHKDIETNEIISDLIEIHFIELKKFKKDNIDNMLDCWIEFINNPQSKIIREIEFRDNVVKEAKDELIKISMNDEQRTLYRLREKAMNDEISALNTAKEKGIKEGIKKERINLAINLINKGIENDFIVEVTRLSEKEINTLRNNCKK